MILEVENIWTYIKIEDDDDEKLISEISDSMSYTVKEYARYRKTFIDFEYSLFEKSELRYPTGLFSIIETVLSLNHCDYDLIDKRVKPKSSTSLTLYGKILRDYQKKAISRSIERERGIVKVATGGGKTVIAAGILSRLNLKSLFIVSSVDLLEQTADEFTKMLKMNIGKIGGGECDIQKINVCTIQTLFSALGLKYKAVDEECKIKEKISKKVLQRKQDIINVIKESEVVIIDECFHGETKVLVDFDKEVKIKDIYENDFITEVISYNHQKHIYEKKKIVKKARSYLTDKWYEVTIKINEKIIKIKTTATHKFWTKNRGYVRVKDLKENDILKFNDSNTILTKVCKISVKYLKHAHNDFYLQFKYNLEIEDNHNYFANNILVSNCQHMSANSYVEMMSSAENVYYKFGLSGTPYRYDGKDIILDAYAGKEIINISASYLIERGFLIKPEIYFLDANKHSSYKFLSKNFNAIYSDWIVNNDYRNNIIVDCVERLVDLDKTILITVTRVKHGEILLTLIEDKLKHVNVSFIKGEVKKKERKKLLNQVRNKELNVIIGTSLADEGLDLPALDAAILAGGGKSLIKSLQRVGRTLRPYPSVEENIKDKAIIVDFYDRLRYLTGQSRKRMAIYKEEPCFEIYENF